ncbi:hypothetical protein BYT27DRAFT_7263511 [Phlegmacium glaucopus]|nr:hypothetical protein BYT27DRAFT_7263511 [Phlegmacium glaucopus]
MPKRPQLILNLSANAQNFLYRPIILSHWYLTSTRICFNPQVLFLRIYSKIMLFQQFTALVTLVVFALQGAMALPHPASDHAQDLVDNTSESTGKTLGSLVGSVAPEALVDGGIEGAGGTLTHPDGVASHDAVDGVLGETGGALGLTAAPLVPASFKDAAIEGAGGIAPP